ncbi:MAG: SDR family NAD(P)-dependent oxidoreductase [Alphaproteobacteria bacterium]|nr:SDR family NAD(P)-dependent oxidoreductase [Alphaproteobacteria bacterium]MBV8548415.1 SDR family NAD(P)-dependent oxidoreductase [Alphaproteobacteria bacterium]
MKVLVTGAAGFIGFHTAQALLAQGVTVVGVDNLNDYYDIRLKEARLSRLTPHPNFTFHKINIADHDAMLALASEKFTHIIHLAAQAGVRYSLQNPYAYVESNLMGHVVLLELARALPQLQHFVYASSSSVYGGNTKIPFSVDDPVEQPISLYAATKRADELMSYTYAHLYRTPCTGLRFFTVYGPWGRPDMAAYIFTRQIVAGEKIKIFNNGDMRRDFTYIDDIVAGILAALSKPPVVAAGSVPARVYNLGNSQAENLMDFIGVLESALGQKAVYDFQPMQPGDVPETFADIAASTRDFGFHPTTSIQTGIQKFVDWYRTYRAEGGHP